MLTMNMLFPAQGSGATQGGPSGLGSSTMRPSPGDDTTGGAPASGAIPSVSSTDPNALSRLAPSLSAPTPTTSAPTASTKATSTGKPTRGKEGQASRTSAAQSSGDLQRGGYDQQPTPKANPPQSGGAQATPTAAPVADPDAILKYRNSLPPGARYYFDNAMAEQERGRHQRIKHENWKAANAAQKERQAILSMKAPSLNNKPTTPTPQPDPEVASEARAPAKRDKALSLID